MAMTDPAAIPADFDAPAFERYRRTQIAVAERRVREGKAPELSLIEARERAEREAEKRRHHFRRDGKAA